MNTRQAIAAMRIHEQPARFWIATYRGPNGAATCTVVSASTSDDAMEVVWDRTGCGSVMVKALPSTFRPARDLSVWE